MRAPPFRSHRGFSDPSRFLRPPIACILLLEDEQTVRLLLAEALARSGYAVLMGASLEEGKQVLARIGWKRIDLVLTDSHLSRDSRIRNGFAFHAWWKSLYPVPPFIFMDGWGGAAPPKETACQVYGLAKPFSFLVLLGLIRAIVGR